MTRDEIREIADIVGDDKAYKHFVNRINKEFSISDDDRNSKVYVLWIRDGETKVGFCVVGYSPAKMKVWKKTFLEEEWVSGEFEMSTDPFELMYMYVKPDYRAKGYSERLFKNVVNFTRQSKVNEIYAYVSDRTPQALNFYKKMNAEVLQDFSDEGIASAFIRWKV